MRLSPRIAVVACGCSMPPHVDPKSTGADSGGPAAAACALPALAISQSWEDTALVDPDEVAGDLGTGGPGIAVLDVDRDGWLDVVMAIPVAPSLLFHNDGTGQLVRSPLALPPANAVSAGDVDGDGWPDLWLGRGDQAPDLLLHNDGAADGLAWTPTELPGALGESYGGTWADLDGDGDLDLFVARFVADFDLRDPDDPHFTPTPNQLLRNDGGTLVDASDQLPAETLDDATFHGAVLDADGDGDLDLYLSNDFGRFWRPNQLLVNDGQGRFQRAQDCGCDLTIFAMGTSVGDVDLDGDDDLYTSNLGGPVLLENDGTGAFFDATLVRGATVPAAPEALASWGTALVDLDLDGDLDLPVIFGQLYTDGTGSLDGYAGVAGDGWENGAAQGDRLLAQVAPGRFEDISAAAGFTDPAVGRAVAVGDLDRDGRPDLVTAGVPFLRTWTTGGGCGPGVTVGPLAPGDRVVATLPDGRRWAHRHWPSTTLSSSAPELVLGTAGATVDVEVWRGDTLLGAETGVGPGDRVALGDGP